MTTEKHWTPPTLEQHLFGPGPKRILSLDGGGTLGVIEIAFLEKIEEVLRKQHGDHPDFRLCDYFDLIGGTSTGALIATGLALRMKACEIKKLYFDMGQKVFKNRLLHIPGYHGYGKYPFRAGALVDVIKPIVGDEQLQSDALKTGLAIVTKRLDTASPWVLTNNRRSLYWRYDPELHDYPFVDNCTFKLLELLRASTAAPLAFNPKTILIGRRATDAAGKPIGDEDEIGVFVDGGLTPYNNPSMKLFMVAGIKKYGFGWRLGAQELQLISIGSGWHRPRIKRDRAERMLAYEAAVASARGAIWDAQVHALTQMQWMSDLVASWKINSEIGDLADDVLAPSDVRSRGLLSFQRFDVQLDKKWLGAALSGSEISREMTQAEVDSLTSDTAFTNPRIMELAYSIASAVAGKQVTSEHFPRDFHLYRVRDVAPEQIIVLLQKAAQEEKSMMEERKNAKLRPPRTVGVVGHRWNRLPSSEPEIARINQQLAAAFDEIQEDRPATDMVLITGLAEGTDRIAAEAALGRGWQLVASLPFSLGRYMKDFETEHSRAEFERLRSRASRLIEAPQADSYADQNLGYAEQGRGLVASSDAIVTVWDGEGAHGTGGTAEIVALAIAKGTRVYWISTVAGAAMKRL